METKGFSELLQGTFALTRATPTELHAKMLSNREFGKRFVAQAC